MKTALVCAIFLGELAIPFEAQAEGLFPRGSRRCPAGRAAEVARGSTVTVVRVRERILPPPVAEMTTGCGPTVEGVLLRVSTAPEPIQMINPLAPPQYGSAGSLVTYSDEYWNRDANPNVRRWQPDGIRLLTFRPPGHFRVNLTQ